MRLLIAILLGTAISLCITVPFGVYLGGLSFFVGIASFGLAVWVLDALTRLFEKKTPYECVPLVAPTENSYQVFGLHNDQDGAKL